MKKLSKIVSLVFILALSAFLFTACADEDDGIIRIGIAMSSSDEFNTNLRMQYEAHAATLEGVEVIFTSAEGSAAQQLLDIENLIVMGMDVIVIRAVEGDAVVTAMQSVRNAGIYIVIDETGVGSDDYDARIAGTQVDHGRMLGEYLQALLNAGEISEINIGYIAGSASAVALGRKEGFFETAPSVNFVAGGAEGFVLADGWSAVEAQNIVEAWIASGLIHDMNVIAAMNDEIANGAIAALAGNFPDMIVLGVDGSAIGQFNIRNGSMRATTFQNNALLARAVLDTSLALVNGETINFDIPAERIVNPRHISLMTLDTIDALIGN